MTSSSLDALAHTLLHLGAKHPSISAGDEHLPASEKVDPRSGKLHLEEDLRSTPKHEMVDAVESVSHSHAGASPSAGEAALGNEMEPGMTALKTDESLAGASMRQGHAGRAAKKRPANDEWLAAEEEYMTEAGSEDEDGNQVKASSSSGGRTGKKRCMDSSLSLTSETWFALTVNESTKAERDFKLFEICSPVQSNGACKARECGRTTDLEVRPEGLAAEGIVFTLSKSVPKTFELPGPSSGQAWCRVEVVQNSKIAFNTPIETYFVQVLREVEMVTHALEILAGERPIEALPEAVRDDSMKLLVQAQEASKVGGQPESGLQAALPAANDAAAIMRTAPGDGESTSATVGRKRFYKSLSCNCWTTEEGEDDGAAHGGEADITTPWHCDICNIFFTSSQALGGHKINSTDHKHRAERLKAADSSCVLPSTPSTPRLSLDVFATLESSSKGKRTRLPPMAHMAGFDRVLTQYPEDVRAAFGRIQSPAAYFSSCSLDVFKRHDKFGNLGKAVIEKYFGGLSETFETLMLNPKQLPELAQVGISVDMSEEEHNELKIFARMMLTKKKFLDINRRAVSKRIKAIRKAGGEKLREFNQKKSKAGGANKEAAARAKSALLPPQPVQISPERMAEAGPSAHITCLPPPPPTLPPESIPGVHGGGTVL